MFGIWSSLPHKIQGILKVVLLSGGFYYPMFTVLSFTYCEYLYVKSV